MRVSILIGMSASFTIENTTIPYSTGELSADQLTIQSVPHNYSVTFLNEKQLNGRLKKIKDINVNKHFAFIDSVVASIYGENIFKGIERFPVIARESNKTLKVATKLLDLLQKKNFTKKETFLTVGGGITQDISSFARAVFKRGIRWTYLPTTLLAMSDSCIGAKACLNYGGVKNLLGLFSTPHEVLIYPGFLKTLSKRDILSGYGEIIKLSIVGGTSSIDTFRSIQQSQGRNLLKNVEQMTMLSLLVKKAVIEIDEFEKNIRKALNYGHTIGHAIEPLVNYKIPHGVAISIGMMIENKIAVKWGSLPQQDANELNRLIAPFIDQISFEFLRNISSEAIIKNMMQDKKTLNNDIYMAVPLKIGHFDMLKIRSDNSFNDYLASILKDLKVNAKHS